MKRPFLSIIIPCYNCEGTIKNTLQSIVDNPIQDEDIEIIIIDDHSTDNFLQVVHTFDDKLNIVYCYNEFDQCVSNTRQTGLNIVTGEWFTFIDSDDMFEPDILSKIKEFIEVNDPPYVVWTKFREYFMDTNKYGTEYSRDSSYTFLHGKFYKTDVTLNEFGCHFPQDYVSHEDTYFNCWDMSNVVEMGETYVFFDIYTYKWIYNEKSLTRIDNNRFMYIENHLNDYIYCSSEPYFDLIKEGFKCKDWLTHQILMCILHAYFFYQASIYKSKLNAITNPDNIIDIHNLKIKIIKELGMDDFDIINYIYSNPISYHDIKKSCMNASCFFIEFQSFRDFILSI